MFPSLCIVLSIPHHPLPSLYYTSGKCCLIFSHLPYNCKRTSVSLDPLTGSGSSPAQTFSECLEQRWWWNTDMSGPHTTHDGRTHTHQDPMQHMIEDYRYVRTPVNTWWWWNRHVRISHNMQGYDRTQYNTWLWNTDMSGPHAAHGSGIQMSRHHLTCDGRIQTCQDSSQHMTME